MTSGQPASVVNALADRFWESILELSPTTATVYGDERYNDRLPDPGPAGRAAARSLAEKTRVEANGIDPDGLSVEVVSGLKKGDRLVERPPKEIS